MMVSYGFAGELEGRLEVCDGDHIAFLTNLFKALVTILLDSSSSREPGEHVQSRTMLYRYGIALFGPRNVDGLRNLRFFHSNKSIRGSAPARTDLSIQHRKAGK
jgi:hypothetical protein